METIIRIVKPSPNNLVKIKRISLKLTYWLEKDLKETENEYNV